MIIKLKYRIYKKKIKKALTNCVSFFHYINE